MLDGVRSAATRDGSVPPGTSGWVSPPDLEGETKLSGAVIRAALEVHRALGPGLLESAYRACLLHELDGRGLNVEREVSLPVLYRGRRVECGYRLDLVVEGGLVVEVKSVRCLTELHTAQLLTYLKLSGIRVGLLINFNVLLLRQGIRRVVDAVGLDAS